MTNDGATILKLLEVEHPAARVLVELAQLQDDEVQVANLYPALHLVLGVIYVSTYIWKCKMCVHMTIANSLLTYAAFGIL